MPPFSATASSSSCVKKLGFGKQAAHLFLLLLIEESPDPHHVLLGPRPEVAQFAELAALGLAQVFAGLTGRGRLGLELG